MQLPQSGEHRRLWRAVTCQSLRLVDDDVVEVTLGQDVARAWIEIAARNAYSPLAELVISFPLHCDRDARSNVLAAA